MDRSITVGSSIAFAIFLTVKKSIEGTSCLLKEEQLNEYGAFILWTLLLHISH